MERSQTVCSVGLCAEHENSNRKLKRNLATCLTSCLSLGYFEISRHKTTELLDKLFFLNILTVKSVVVGLSIMFPGDK